MYSFHLRSFDIFSQMKIYPLTLKANFFLVWILSFNFLIYGLSVWNAPESIGKWSGRQNKCPIPLKRYEIPGVQRKQMRHKPELEYLYITCRSFGLKVTVATIHKTTRWHFDGLWNVPVYISGVVVFWCC